MHLSLRRRLTGGAAAVLALVTIPPLTQLGTPAYATPGTVRIFVAPDGHGGACTERRPCTLERAIARERSARARMSSDIVVYLRGGTYRVDEPIELGARDSGRNGHRVVFRNYPSESPIISGGERLRHWRSEGHGVWSASTRGREDFLQLYARGHELARAHSEPVLGERWTIDGSRKMMVRIPAASVPANGIKDLTGVQVRIMDTWRELHYPVESIGPEVDGFRFLQLKDPIATWSNEPYWDPADPSRRYGLNPVATETAKRKFGGETILIGARELMDHNGEWYLDARRDRVYLKAGFDPNRVEMTTPGTEQLLGIEGARGITIYGVQFAHSAWNTPLYQGNFQRQGGVRQTDTPNGLLPDPKGGHDRPLWWVNPAAVRIGHSTDIRLERNGFRDTGANAINLDAGTTDVRMVGNLFTDIGDSAIFVGTPQLPIAPASERNTDTQVVDNLIVRTGRVYATDSAITMTYPHGALIQHNTIEQVNNIAVNTGYVQGLGPDYRTDMQDVQILDNRIAGACLTARDCGGWHNVGLAYHDEQVPRSHVARNYLTHIVPNTNNDHPAAGVRGLYADAGTNGFALEDNVCGSDVDPCVHLNKVGGDVDADHAEATDPAPVMAGAGLSRRYRFLTHIDLTTDSIGGRHGPHPRTRG